jgi:hypothetical protein
MKQPDRAIQRRPLGRVMRGLALPAVLLCAIGSAEAQTGSPVEGGPVEPKTETAEPPQVTAVAKTPGDGFTVGAFTFKPGGRIKLDVIRDFDLITSEDSFDPRTIPIDAGEGGNSQLHARETRLYVDVRGPAEGRELRMYVETDFYGSGNALRLRHAYGSWGGLLAGQTWSVFVDDANFPNTIDFESPLAFPQIRQAQLRYGQQLGANVSWAAAVEDNKSAIESPTGAPGKAEYPMPDVTGHLRFGGSGGHAFVSGFLGKARFRPTQGDLDTVTLWGGLLSGRLKFGRDALYGQFTFGDGVGRYRGGITAVPDANGELAPVGLYALMGGYEHYWSSRFSSNAVYSVVSAPDEDYYADDFNERLDYGAVNLLYWFLPDRAWFGIEYLYGRREVFDGGVGRADRVQFAVRFNLP